MDTHKLLLTRWRADPSKAIELRGLLNNTLLREALDLLVTAGLPDETGTPEGVDYAVWRSHQQTRNEGYFTFYRNLGALTLVADIPVNTTQISEVKPWAHLKPKE